MEVAWAKDRKIGGSFFLLQIFENSLKQLDRATQSAAFSFRKGAIWRRARPNTQAPADLVEAFELIRPLTVDSDDGESRPLLPGSHFTIGQLIGLIDQATYSILF